MAATDGARAGFLRRFAAIVYDSLVLFAILCVATLIVLLFRGGQAIPPNEPLYLLYLIAVSFLYFGWFWTHGGQTLGMRAWRLRIKHQQGEIVTWKHALLRFLSAVLSWLPVGAGYVWMLVDRSGFAWHDRLSGTRVILTPKAEY